MLGFAPVTAPTCGLLGARESPRTLHGSLHDPNGGLHSDSNCVSSERAALAPVRHALRRGRFHGPVGGTRFSPLCDP